jgi:hypothetical protein
VLWIGIGLTPIRDPDPNFHGDADQDPDPDWHKNDAMRILPQALYMFENQIFLLLVTALSFYNVLSFSSVLMFHNFQYFEHHTEIFWKKV